jgi:hypothetical protein
MRLKILKGGCRGSDTHKKIEIINHFIDIYDEDSNFRSVCNGRMWRAIKEVTAILNDRILEVTFKDGEEGCWALEWSVDALVNKIIEEGYYDSRV